MQQLITIETVPISIKYEATQPAPAAKELTEGAGSSAENDRGPKVSQASPAKPIRIRTDSFVHSRSVGVYNLTYTATARYNENGKLKLNVQMNGADGNDLVFRRFGRDIRDVMSRVLEAEEGSAYDPESMVLDFDLEGLNDKAPGSSNTGRAFTPPDFELEILEMPKVIIKYVGGPIYIPKSADPNYEAPVWAED